LEPVEVMPVDRQSIIEYQSQGIVAGKAPEQTMKYIDASREAYWKLSQVRRK
jgi:hypothetical protein